MKGLQIHSGQKKPPQGATPKVDDGHKFFRPI